MITPVAFDQPTWAARAAWLGVADERTPTFSNATPQALSAAIAKVAASEAVGGAAARLQAALLREDKATGGGDSVAAEKLVQMLATITGASQK